MTESSLWPLALYFASVLGMVGVVLVLSALLGEKTTLKRATAEPFEGGIVHIGSADIPITVEFYLIAMFFVIFDLETVYIFAWAIAFYELGVFGYLAVSVFILILVVALIYEWKSGALEWGVKTRKGLPKGFRLDKAED
ncbi:MAG TPA: NADH-quinone oxidoreductase subunit A [Pseudomonadales bacterium]|nr:NADH-quinone oxidoreductase subunit A [Pseudomonadales bacterium]MDP6317053.1 NADH-quinone oxidoreductase subunit A [Pseudomonadales bacterium]MDP7316228.1 NADH-quinone oxidoreductase subunit A [Pseudomonadales bacterium]MDP7577077.1 NADH-quinone oxidoreductase subunit A [Pseudomonadales bacterium]HJL60525.1 NADH-quinone oxidoreductase subunit A [Pseudomonadales bacterium]